ncbi:hypothetical protein CEV34_0897 [Brucella pseudogrignonensis]|uniref:Uncharacterized protein n=1 Tax=Brucella pseudogrignonensis TaxID=419475 RepID=A0A256GQG4_9HYPH|nr:hypothetical protein CEV34_0897 [Brucella pseudogrignonensis]
MPKGMMMAISRRHILYWGMFGRKPAHFTALPASLELV